MHLDRLDLPKYEYGFLGPCGRLVAENLNIRVRVSSSTSHGINKISNFCFFGCCVDNLHGKVSYVPRPLHHFIQIVQIHI